MARSQTDPTPDGGSVAAIRPALANDMALLPAIELAAGRPFADIEMVEIAEAPLPSPEDLVPYQVDGRCWVVPGEDGRPVAYLIADLVDGCCHIEQVSVHPDFAGRRLGRALIEHAGSWAVARGLAALTLTTFVEVPWNGPYYRRCGFRFLEPEDETPGLKAIRSAEKADGLDRWPRACMRRDLP